MPKLKQLKKWMKSWLIRAIYKLFSQDEGERYKIIIRPGDHYSFSHEGEEAINYWLEDTLGRRHKINNAKNHIKKLWS